VVPESLSDPTTVFLLRAAALYEKTVVIAHEPQSSYQLIWPSDLDGVFRDKSVAFHTDHADYASHRLGAKLDAVQSGSFEPASKPHPALKPLDLDYQAYLCNAPTGAGIVAQLQQNLGAKDYRMFHDNSGIFMFADLAQVGGGLWVVACGWWLVVGDSTYLVVVETYQLWLLN
jgi:hypothetical protein